MLGSLVGRVPDSILSISLLLLVRSSTGSYASAGVAAAGFALGSAASAPLAGRALDRFGQRRLLVAMALAFATALLALLFAASTAPAAVTIALAAGAGLVRPPLDASLRALWPRVVPAARLQAAYSLDATFQELIWIAGPLLLSALLLLGGPSLPLLACAALSLAGTVTYATSPAVAGEPAAPSRRRGQGLFGLRLVSLLGAATLYGVAAGILTVTLTAFSTAHHSRAAVGVLVAVWGVGSILGGLAYGSRRWRAAPERRALWLLAALAVLLGLLAIAPGVAILALLMLPLGLPLSPWLGTLNEAVQALVSPDRVAEAFTWVYALITVGIAAGNAVGGPVIERAGTGSGFVAAGAAAGAGVVIGAAGLAIRRHRHATA